ncbi:hypothetical protein RintRC_1505 [Richelia intracellularis]|nr:hypothetical protein RintRC_1505 [Richelia intracellularis]
MDSDIVGRLRLASGKRENRMVILTYAFMDWEDLYFDSGD